MKKLFIINPRAGKGTDALSLAAEINRISEELNEDVNVYITKERGDASRYVREYLGENGAARIIACGGDGTLGEVLNGAANFPETQIGVIPRGTGNDFCRNFDGSPDFESIEAQIKGECVKCDAIAWRTSTENGVHSGLCGNMFNIGFDCNVADLTGHMKKNSILSGPFAYLYSIFVTLIKKKGANLLIELDGREVHRGFLLLSSIANGCFCGGGIKSNPTASLHDGVMNVNIIKNVSRLRLLTLLPYYMKGTHMKLKNIEKIISELDCKKAVIKPLDGEMRLCIDGEICDAGTAEFEVVKDAFNFVLPDLKTAKITAKV